MERLKPASVYSDQMSTDRQGQHWAYASVKRFCQIKFELAAANAAAAAYASKQGGKQYSEKCF